MSKLYHLGPVLIVQRGTSGTTFYCLKQVTRYTILSKLEKTAEAKKDALIARLWYYPKRLRKTMTTDNGGENFTHKEVTSALSTLMYFCHAFHSWEKGTVENTNGRIHRYIPKGKSIDTLSEEDIAKVEHDLNHTPRKCLGFLTPDEAMSKVLAREKADTISREILFEQATLWLDRYPL